MKKKLIGFSCEVSLERNGINVPFKQFKVGKVKEICLYVYHEIDNSKNIIFNNKLQEPFVQVNLNNVGADILYQFSPRKVKNLSTRFQEKGRITIEIEEDFKTVLVNDKNEFFEQNKTCFLFVSNAIKENLNNFCELLKEIKMKLIMNDQSQLQQQQHQTIKQQNDQIKDEQQTQMALNNKNNQQTNLIVQSQHQQRLNQFKVNRNLLQCHANNTQNKNPNIAYDQQKQQQQLSQSQMVSQRSKGTDLNQQNLFNAQKRQILSTQKNSQLDKQYTVEYFRDRLIKSEIKQQNYLIDMPNILLEKIFEFIPMSELLKHRLVCQEFRNFIWCMIKNLNLAKIRGASTNMILKILNNCKNVKKIQFGKLLQINQTNFINDLQCQQNNLQVIDFSDYTQLSDKIIDRFCTRCKQLKKVKLCYYSKITDSSLHYIKNFLPGLQELALKSNQDDKFDLNKQISESTIIACLHERVSIKALQLHCFTANLLDKLTSHDDQVMQQIQQQEDSLMQLGNQQQKVESNTPMTKDHIILQRLQKLKIQNYLLISQEIQDYSLQQLQRCQQLKSFTLNHMIELQSKSVMIDQCSLIMQQVIKNMKQLDKFTACEWCDNQILKATAQSCLGLKKIDIKSLQINDFGLSYILTSLRELEKVCVFFCPKISGHCFEQVLSTKLKHIEINCDDYNMKCLKFALEQQLIFPDLVTIKA